jgi:hypothetical protein
MGTFERELMRRSPLAACVLDLASYIFDGDLLASVWDANRGRCYDDVLKFDQFLDLMRDALIRHKGSGHALFVELEATRSHPIDESNFYRKLARMPVAVSRALLTQGTARLRELVPVEAVKLPECFDAFEVVIGDGKKIKNAAKRLKPTRGYSGKLLAAKALVGMDARSGMPLAMSDSLDGLTNDVPLIPELMEQLRGLGDRPLLTVWDRQFDNARSIREMTRRAGDHYVIRTSQAHLFEAESSCVTRDDLGREVLDEIGVMGKGKDALRVRRVRLRRGAEGEDVAVLTDLLDRGDYAASALLELYKHRWSIEPLFQQVTETFALSHLIGSGAKAALLQLSYCMLLYNMMQVIKALVAEDGGVLMSMVSMHYLFNDVKKELIAWAYHGGEWPRQSRTLEETRSRLRELTRGRWHPKRYGKQPDKKPRGKPQPVKRLHGGHTSVLRILEGRAKVVNA